MNRYDSRIYWQAMCRQMQGLAGNALGRTVGKALQARYEEPAQPLPPALDALMDRLQASERTSEPALEPAKRD